jgi:hypothetical protein
MLARPAEGEEIGASGLFFQEKIEKARSLA